MLKIPEAETGLQLLTLSALSRGEKWRTEAMHSHRNHLLLWITRGQGRLTGEGMKMGYTAQNAIFIPSRAMYSIEISNAVYGTALFINPSMGLDLPEETTLLRINDMSMQAQLATKLDTIQTEIESSHPDKSDALYFQAGLLAVWINRAQRQAQQAGPKTSKSIQLIKSYSRLVERHFRSGRSVADYADMLDITTTHLTRVCNQSCGRAASTLLADRIFFDARRQLRESRKPVKEIAENLGYRSAAYFSRAFYNHTGLSPSEFRNNA